MTASYAWRCLLVMSMACTGCGIAVPIPVAVQAAKPDSSQTEAVVTPAPAEISAPEAPPAAAELQSTAPTADSEQVALGENEPNRVGIPTFSNGAPELRYRWKDGGSYAYKVQIEADVVDTIHTHSGRLTWTARAKKAEPTVTSEPEKPTATAFVVTSDGYLLTCAHVVEGASSLSVALQGKTYPAKVVATDGPNDLALIKIEARKLPLLPLGDSDQIELGQEIRAIGFPLSSVLGDSLKAVRGTVSGIDTRDGRKRIQIDAGVNPGNSGGPLVNERGEVEGITSAKLTGSTVSSVGFGVPVNYAKALLAKHKVECATGSTGAKLDGPTLVRTVAPAVALVTVTLRDGSTAAGEIVTLAYSGSLTQSERQKNPQRFSPGAFPRIPRGPSIRPPSFGFNRTANEVEVDALGNIQDTRGGDSLPFMLGNASHLILEPLSEHGEQTWETSSTTTIIEREKEDDRFGPMLRPRFGPRGFVEPEEPEGTKYPATERTQYRVVRKDGDVVTLHKTYELKTESKANEDPYLKLTGEADITFDLKEGVPVEMTYKGAVAVNKQNVSVKIPLTFTYKKLTPEELKPTPPAVAATPTEPGKPAAPVVTAAAPETELTNEQIDAHLAQLKSEKLFDWHRAVRAFERAKPTESRRAEVARALETAAARDDLTTRWSAVKGLARWGDKESVPALIACLEHKDSLTRGEALGVLVNLGDERVIEPVAQCMKDIGSRRKAAELLKKLGSASEPALIKLLDEEKDLFLRKDICDLLKDVGTQASLATLKTAAKDSNPFLSQAADAAIKAISAR